MDKVTIDEVVDSIEDGASLAFSGFFLTGFAREAVIRIREKFLETGHPRDLTVIHVGGIGDNVLEGIYEIMLEGLVTKYISGHFMNSRITADLVNQNALEAYNLPIGVMTKIYRAMAEGQKHYLSKVGLHTFIDPRHGGGRMNEATREDIVHLVEVDGEEYLSYDLFDIDYAFIRGTEADVHGNITMTDETGRADTLELAMATTACGGKVIAQVKRYVLHESIPRRDVMIPGIFVDAAYVTSDMYEFHKQTVNTMSDPILTGERRMDITQRKVPLKLNERKIIARRAALELEKGAVVNLGIGIPEAIGRVTDEEGVAHYITLTIESGIIGGVPLGSKQFGSAVNAWAAVPMSNIFDFYDCGGLDKTFLGFAEVDQMGNVNVNKFGDRIAGIGGFINISQNTKKIVFCGTMTAGGLETKVEDGKLIIVQEGSRRKFIRKIEQISYNAQFGIENEQECIFITERCVLKPTTDGLKLIEVAPGIDIERDIQAHMDYPLIVDGNETLMRPEIFDIMPMNLKTLFHTGKF